MSLVSFPLSALSQGILSLLINGETHSLVSSLESFLCLLSAFSNMELRVLVDGKDGQKDVSLITVIGNFPQPSDSV